MNATPVTQIDAARIVKERFGISLARPAAAFLEWFIAQDKINDTLRKIGPLKNAEFMRKGLEVLDISLRVEGEERLPEPGTRSMFVCNHPLGGIDVLAAVSAVAPHYPEGLMIPANDLLVSLSPISEMLIPVNKVGSQHKELSGRIRDAFASDVQLMFFPAGKVSRRRKGVIADDEWKKNFVSKSVESGRCIVPIKIEGKNSNAFYNVANLRTRLRIKFNIEMLMLPRELFKQCGKTLRVIIGNPIDSRSLDPSKSYREHAQQIRKIVYELS